MIQNLIMISKKVYKEKGLKQLVYTILLYIKECIVFLFAGSGDVLYVSGSMGAPKYYRCLNKSEELERYGIRSIIISQYNLNLLRLIKNYKIIIFQRVIYSTHIEKVIEEIKRQKKTIFFETDDLVFDPQYISHMHYLKFVSDEGRLWQENGIGREILEDPYVENCIVSTSYLSKMLNRRYPQKNIFVLANKLSKKQVYWAQKALSEKNKTQFENGRIRIGYFPGSNSHDMDFETISDVLLKIMEENNNVVLMIVGPLNISGHFSKVKSQIERHPFVSLKKLSELILYADINIVPLEMDNPFCQSKSGLKFFEAGILKIPTVASSTDSYCQIIENGTNGFLAKNNDDWYNYLTILIENKELRDKIGARAQLTSLEKHTTQENHPETEEFVHFIKEKLMSPACKVHRNLQY